MAIGDGLSSDGYKGGDGLFWCAGKKSGEAFGGVTGLGAKVTRNLVGEPFVFFLVVE